MIRLHGLPHPHFWIPSLRELEFEPLARLGVKGVLFDVDNTLVPPREHVLAPAVREHLLEQRLGSPIERWALASNSWRDLSGLAIEMDAAVIRRGLLIAKPRKAYFMRALEVLEMRPSEVAMIGDKLVHDIAPAARLGIHTVLVRASSRDQAIDRLFLRRTRERKLSRAIQPLVAADLALVARR